jgi:hypothetical protein
MKPHYASGTPFAPISLDLSELGEHLDHCKQAGGRFFTFRCGAEAIRSFVSCRLVTCAVVAFTLIGLGSLAF